MVSPCRCDICNSLTPSPAIVSKIYKPPFEFTGKIIKVAADVSRYCAGVQRWRLSSGGGKHGFEHRHHTRARLSQHGAALRGRPRNEQAMFLGTRPGECGAETVRLTDRSSIHDRPFISRGDH